MSDLVTLNIGPDIFTGWSEVAINRSIDTVAGSFELAIVDVWDDDEVIGLYPLQRCKLKVGDRSLITGYIDKQSPTITESNSAVQISGRCKTGDLVDCSSVSTPGEWKNASIEKIVRSVLNPQFGINLVIDADLSKKLNKFNVNFGESVFETISRACENTAILPLSTVDGDLLLTNVGSSRAHDDLFYGGNIDSASVDVDFTNRFSSYIIKGQKTGDGGTWNKQKTNNIYAESSDQYIDRYRPKGISADNQISNTLAKRRVDWEAQVRAGRSVSVKVELPTWEQSNGDLWRENLIVYTYIPRLRVDGDMVVREITYKLNGNNRRLSMSLVEPDIYAPEPKPVKKKSRKGKAVWLG